ncbi:MAG: TCP-1/cpn60 chaperonin family protein [Chloroflexota bacterium]
MTRTSKPWQTPKVIFNPQAYQGMQRGINALVDAVRPTLGPFSRLVINDDAIRQHKLEFLDSAALIARRITQIENRDADMGAMYLRQLLWHLHETTGDGTAAAAVLFESVYNLGIRYLVAGGNAMRLRRYLDEGAGFILEQFAGQTQQVSGPGELARLAETICYDPPLSQALGQAFDLIGPYGRLEIRPGRGRDIEQEYVQGSYWDSGLSSPLLVTDARTQRAELDNPAILISDLEVQEPQDLIPILEATLSSGAESLLLIVKALSEKALSLLASPANRQRLPMTAVKTPGAEMTKLHNHLQDIAILTGGQFLTQATGAKLDAVRIEHLGRARHAWANDQYFGITTGSGDPISIRQHTASLKAAYERAEKASDQKDLLARLGNLLGGTAVLWIGDLNLTTLELRKEKASRTADALRGALRHGLLPGGGVALLDCRPALQARLHAAGDADERAAYHILLQAVEAPFRTLLHNAGFNPSEIFAQLPQSEPGYGFDVTRQRTVNMSQAGILDSAAVIRAATWGAIHSAALALTVDVLVHKANPLDSSHAP